jgi:uncharacterized membrane protein
MNIALWIVSGILAAAYLAAGLMKSLRPKESLQPNLPWVADFSAGTVRLIGVAELLGAIGLILPWATDTARVLTPLAAVGLVVIQALAIPVHLRRKEPKALSANLPLLVAAAFVAIGRFATL